MNIKQDWASASISIIYKIGKYKEKTTKDVDTSRMGVTSDFLKKSSINCSFSDKSRIFAP